MRLSFHKQIASVVGALLLVPFFCDAADARHHISTSDALIQKGVSRHGTAVCRSSHHRHRRRSVAHQPQQQQQQVGALVMTESGQIVYDQLSDNQFNPASVAKIVTSYAAIKTFGLDHQFTTTAFQQGQLNRSTGVLHGNVYVKGSDPDFRSGDALAMLQSLREAGITAIDGKIVVGSDFSYGSAGDPAWSAHRLLRAWSAGKCGIRVIHGCAVGEIPPGVAPIAEHNSEPLRFTLKEMLSYSLNNVAEQLGRCTGGISKIEAIVEQQSGLKPGELQLASASGLGRSRVSPRDMMQVLRAFRGELQHSGLDLEDVLPVAGIDGGTLDERFVDGLERGSVVGKTGTLPGTDGGASALVGMCRAQNENLYFVIFCWRGNVVSFRHQQDQLIRKLQADRGGPRPFDYAVQPEISRL